MAVGLSIGAAVGVQAVVTSDGFGTHLTVDGLKIDLSHRYPAGSAPPLLDHDSVGKLEFFRPDFGETSCSSAVIFTPLGKAALTAAHCLVPYGETEITASDFTLSVLDSAGSWQSYSTNDPQNVFVHPNYDGYGTHGYDLAIVFFDQEIDLWVTAYSVAEDSTDILSAGKRIVKFGFGRTADGIANPVLDGLKRWGLNSYESRGLGEYGVPLDDGWNNTETQVTSDFDDTTVIDHNFFNFFENFNGTQIIPRIPSWGGGTTGWLDDEVFASNGDSGGPNFLYDPAQGWVIVAVTSYRYQTPPGILGYPGTPDINVNYWSTFGEYEGDAVVTESFVDQVLGLEPPPSIGKPFGGSRLGNLSEGGHLGPAE